jgi:DNA-binding PadR family transcriptional regulator
MNIKLAILGVLKDCGRWALITSILKTEVRIRVGGPLGDSEFFDALTQLKDKGLVNTRIDDITGDTRYFITEQGKTALAQ